ncbi:MAG: hypothetical protein M0P20_10405 [Methanocorpusculum sp.]|nr:hypothetical protein [Methanocorpusculum sp.]MDD3271550.1 hypothetical protein [Syntrophomonadaceae bacterium]MDD3898648.1 hypothetical protein [Syntrophomonadaceae bacterium]
MVTRPLRPTRHDEGYVLVWVIFYFMLLYLIAMSFANSSFLEELISINHRQDAQAFEMAEGGVLAGVEGIYTIMESDYSHSQDIPTELILSKKEWILHESGKEMGFYLDNPKCVYVDEDECHFKFTSKGVSLPAQKSLVAKVQVEFLDVYAIEADGGLVFDHREFIPPAKIISLQYK